MGRDARIRRALGADNRGNRGRIVMAHGTCTQLLAADLRMQQQYLAWLYAQDYHRRTGPPPWVRTPAQLQRCMAAIRDAEITFIANVLRDIGFPWRWCAEALVCAYFPAMRHNAQHPHEPRVIHVSAGLHGVRPGQAPPHDGQMIAENVRWWYRHRIKSPSDSIHALAEEWALREQRNTDCRSVIQDGISRAEALLKMVIPR
jgi:hypothetical protein